MERLAKFAVCNFFVIYFGLKQLKSILLDYWNEIYIKSLPRLLILILQLRE